MPSDLTKAGPVAMPGVLPVAEELVKNLTLRKETVAAAESCTAGLAADLIVCIPGASKVFWGSFVSYMADAKHRMLGLPAEFIEKHGEVSRPVALAMAEGALEKSGASWAFSVTGLAGPGDDGRVPVGTVWIGTAGRDTKGLLLSDAKMFLFTGSRNEVREAAAAAALHALMERVRDAAFRNVTGY